MTAKTLGTKLSEIRKFLVALAAVLGVALGQFTTDGAVRHWITIASAIVGAILVYWVPNNSPENTPTE